MDSTKTNIREKREEIENQEYFTSRTGKKQQKHLV